MTNLFLAFLEISLPISLLIILLLLLTPFFDGRYAARWKYWIWIVLALRLLIPLGANGGGPAAPLRPQRETPVLSESGQIVSNPSASPESEQTVSDPSASPGSGQTVPEPSGSGTVRGRVIVEIPAQMAAPIAVRPEKAGNSISWLDLIGCVWAAGGAVAVSVSLASYWLCRYRLRKKGSAVKDGDVLRLLQKLKCELQIRRTVSVVENPDASSPMLIGFSDPVLVLPKAQYHAEELYFILKHELVHLKRGDLYFKLLFAAVRAVHWFNPLVRVMQKEAAVDMELSCDEQVMRNSGYAQRRAYTEVLLSALDQQNAKRIALSTNFYGGKQVMKRRFQNILAKTGKKSGAAVFACAVILTMSMGTLVGCSITPGSPAAAPGASAGSGSSAVPGPAIVPAPSGAENPQAGSIQGDLPLPDPADAASIAAAFVPGMGCSDPTCTDAAHHHDCPADCADYEHHHACALDCTEAGHHHVTVTAHAFVDLGNSGNSGTSGHHSGHHADAHHG